MELTIYVVDAFTDKQFKGNSAAVIPVQDWLPVDVMQNIASENNLSETAFIKKIAGNQYAIRWFSPMIEIDFCGHATLASSFVLFNFYGVESDIEFVTLEVGSLIVKKLANDRIEMSFPNQLPDVVDCIPQAVIDGLSIKPIKVLKNRQAYFAIYANKTDVLNVEYNSAQLKLLAPFDLVVTASGETTEPFLINSDAINEADFVSRYFWPANGGDEDPVTGSIHTGLVPYWSKVLKKNSLVAFQASERGGKLYCELQGDRVLVSGTAVLYLKGTIFV